MRLLPESKISLGKKAKTLGGGCGTETGDGLEQGGCVRIACLKSKLCDLFIQCAQARFHAQQSLEYEQQGRSARRSSSGSAMESAARVLSAAALGRSIQFFSIVERRIFAMAAGVGAWAKAARIPTPSTSSKSPSSGKLKSSRLLLGLF